jgi:hypothetical protein
MNCREFWDNGAEAPEHLRECPVCAAAYDRERRLAAGLNALRPLWRREEAPERIERQLVAEFRRSFRPALPPRTAGWMPALAWGMAVAATVVLALALIHERQPRQLHQAAPRAVELAAANAVDPADAVVSYGEGFIPLPNAEQIDPEEEVDMVRVEVPRSAIVAMGIPVNEDLAPEQVEADVVLGADGMARAVRVLNNF